MSVKAEILTALCTVSCALGIGYIMQSGQAAELRYGSGERAAPQTVMTVARATSSPFTVRDMAFAKDGEIVAVEGVMLTSADMPRAKTMEHTLATVDLLDDTGAPLLAHDPECDLSARAVVDGDAVMTLVVDAPCYGGEPVIVTYAQQNFDGQLSPEGTLEAAMPVSGEHAQVRIAFANGEHITALAH